MSLIASLQADSATVTAFRRDIHAHPELCFEERRTADLVASGLEALGIEVHRGLGTTGVVGVIHGDLKPAGKGRSIGFRADMDALPIQEANTFAHASTYPGKMHGCGHDGHTAMLMGAARHLATNRNFAGTVYLIFQPAEEGGGGAREMIKDGLFERFEMDAVFAIHNWPGMPAGTVGVSPGAVMASSNEFYITLKGKGAHAAMPHLGADPVPVACQLVQAFQTIVSRNLNPNDPAVISVTQINAGETTNVIPNTCRLAGTVRTFSNDVLDDIQARMQQLSEQISEGFGLDVDFSFVRNYPPTINDAGASAFVQKALQGLLSPEQIVPQVPTMGAEDFSYMLQAKPGAYLFLGNGEGDHRSLGHGAGPCTLHNPSYDFNDALLPVGAAIWVTLVHQWMAQDHQADPS